MNKGWKYVKKHVREILNCLEQTFSRSVWTLKSLLVIGQKEVRYMLLETGEVSLFPEATGKVENVPGELHDLDKISKALKVCLAEADVLLLYVLLLIIKCKKTEVNYKLRDKLLKGVGFNCFENYQPLLTARYTEFMKWLPKFKLKALSGTNDSSCKE